MLPLCWGCSPACVSCLSDAPSAKLAKWAAAFAVQPRYAVQPGLLSCDVVPAHIAEEGSGAHGTAGGGQCAHGSGRAAAQRQPAAVARVHSLLPGGACLCCRQLLQLTEGQSTEWGKHWEGSMGAQAGVQDIPDPKRAVHTRWMVQQSADQDWTDAAAEPCCSLFQVQQACTRTTAQQTWLIACTLGCRRLQTALSLRRPTSWRRTSPSLEVAQLTTAVDQPAWTKLLNN